ncbi:hypothetical protein BT96DRAFT_957751 [Gymnopus androsaceus JB14]|uniref:DDE Tnp4 domain-containing protein n=1 Tax=Gymnopus androsaceus JB14 TaxID=1447944 RepID=A0A6A4HLF6_9AGAR|nr:hypothetical protein BT96DRAFT_957751 [Gymnopus androsaceus JB14]
MENDFLSSLLQLQQQEEEDREEPQHNLLILGALVLSINGNNSECICCRNPSHCYLTCPQLMPDPHLESPWIHLTFWFILEHFAKIWNCNPHLPAHSLDAAGALGLTLHYLGSAIPEVQLQQIFAIVPSMKEAHIKLPLKIEEFEELSALITTRHPLLERAFASIDGLSLDVEVSNDPELENATYNGWKIDHRITNVLIFSPKGTIIDCPEGFYVISSTAFPQVEVSMHGKIHAPMKGGECIPADLTAEWSMHIVQGSLGHLHVTLDINNAAGCLPAVRNCCSFNQCGAECVGINQICSVSLPTWKALEDEKALG